MTVQKRKLSPKKQSRPTAADEFIDQLRALNADATADDDACDSADTMRANSDTLIKQWATERSDLDLSLFSLSLRVRRIGMLLDELLARECEELGIKQNEMLLLFALRRIGPPYCLRPTDIQTLTMVTSGTVTYRIDQLVKQGLADRIPDPSDRRGYLIKLTEHGSKVVDAAVEASVASSNLLLAPLAEVPHAMDALAEMLRLYESRLDELAKERDR